MKTAADNALWAMKVFTVLVLLDCVLALPYNVIRGTGGQAMICVVSLQVNIFVLRKLIHTHRALRKATGIKTMRRRPHHEPYLRLDYKPDGCPDAGLCFCDDCSNGEVRRQAGSGQSHCWRHSRRCHIRCK